jgi:hypothetical protein
MDIIILITLIGFIVLILINFSIYIGTYRDPCANLLRQVSDISGLKIVENPNHAYPNLTGNCFGRYTKVDFFNIGGGEGVLPSVHLVIRIEINSHVNTYTEIRKRVPICNYHPKPGALLKDLYTIKVLPNSLVDFFFNKNIQSDLIKIDFDLLTIKEQAVQLEIHRLITDPWYVCSALIILSTVLDSFEDTYKKRLALEKKLGNGIALEA